MAAYGRLDVYWPDGPIESYPLEKPVIAIGRSSGNDIVLDTTAVSRYHVSLSLQGEKVLLKDLDAVNGTYIDGDRMAANTERQLKGGEEIQIGDVRLIYQPLSDESTTVPITTKFAVDPIASEPTTAHELPAFVIQIEQLDLTVTPGATNQTVIDIHNASTEVERYTLQVEGLPKDWVRLDRTEAELSPNSHSQVVMSFKPTRRPESKPGDYPFTVRVMARAHPEQIVENTGLLHVLNYSGFGILLATHRVQSSSGQFELFVQNQGSAPLLIGLSGTDPVRALNFDIRPDNVTLNAGERRTVRGTIRAKRSRWFGPAREYRFDVIARAKDASGFQAPVSGIFVERSNLPFWVPLAVLGGLLAAVVMVGLLGLFVILPALAPAATATLTATITPTIYITAPPTFTPSPMPPSETPTETLTEIPTILTETPFPTVIAITPSVAVFSVSTVSSPATDAPTEIPTLEPTSIPTLAPTVSPTLIPTSSATTTPTSAPIPSPIRSDTF